MQKLPMWIEERDGLRFSCTGCGGCCRGPGGFVWLETDAEVERLAAFLGLPLARFTKRYVRSIGGDLALVDQPGSGDCVFWDDERGCTVYEARPTQCRTFPFWEENVKSPRAWRDVQARCPGAAAEGGRLYSPDEIRAALAGGGETDPGTVGGGACCHG